jgi:hypothetical protein
MTMTPSETKQSTLSSAASEAHEHQALRFRDREDGGLDQVTPPEEASAAVKQMLGIWDSSTLATRLHGQVVSVMKAVGRGKVKASDINDASALLAQIGPADAVEGMLAVQMIGAHSAAMECLGRASLDEQTFEGREVNYNRAVKLMRVYAAQVEALNRHRNKAKQTVEVRHIHIHEGGQAIVGNVTQREGGGGEP